MHRPTPQAMCMLLALVVAGVDHVAAQSAPTQTAKASKPTLTDQQIRDQISKLRKLVKANPLDSSSRRKLLELLETRKLRDGKALDSLIHGLQDYLAAHYSHAEQALVKAESSHLVRGIAQQKLRTTSLKQLIKQCQTKKTSTATKPGAKVASMCPICGDTLIADCAKCKGLGITPCRTCRGTGQVIRKGSKYKYPCPRCGRKGAITCTVCLGRTVRQCTASRHGGKRTAPRPASIINTKAVNNTPEQREVRELIALTWYLRTGGLNLYSPDALKTSPAKDKAAAYKSKPAPKPASK